MCSAGRKLVLTALACLLGQGAALAQEGGIRPVLPASAGLRSGWPADQGWGRPGSAVTWKVKDGARSLAQKRPRSRIYLGAALCTCGGTLAWWSAHQADQAYARYRHAAGYRQQQDQFRRAERYDRLAGAGFAAMEAGLVLTAYWTFF